MSAQQHDWLILSKLPSLAILATAYFALPQLAQAEESAIAIFEETIDSARAKDSDGSIIFQAVPKVRKTLLCYYEYNTNTCQITSTGTWQVLIAPAHGKNTFGIENRTKSSGSCAGYVFPCNVAYYTWTDTSRAATEDSFAARWSTPDGKFLHDIYWLAKPLRIASPTDKSDYPLGQSNHTETSALQLLANSGDAAVSIDWTLSLQYATSGGKGAFTDTRTFMTQPSATQTTTYASMGGKLTIKSTQNAGIDTVEVFITGVSIANAEVTNRLVALYAGGATPKLMTGIAYKESTYQQFRKQSLYEHPGLWPNSSYDGGSHVGLM